MAVDSRRYDIDWLRIIAVATLLFSWLSYELIIKRVNYLRPLFGLNYK